MGDHLNVLVVMKMDDERRRILEAVAPNANYTYTSFKEVSELDVKKYDVILGGVPVSVLKDCENLKWLQLNYAGSDPFQKEGAFPRNAILTNASGSYGVAISEHLLGMLLSVSKKLNIYRDSQNQCIWKDEGKVLPITGTTTVIIGLGDIGSEFAKRMKAMGSYVIGVRRSNLNKPDYVDEVHLSEDLDKLVKRADVIALSVPDTKDTKNILSRERIESLKENAIVLNVGRGTAIDTEALTEALENNKIYGAGLDVTAPEPLPADHRLWKQRNALITPHVSGKDNLDYTYNMIFEIFIHNFKAFVNHEEMKNVVDFDRGY